MQTNINLIQAILFLSVLNAVSYIVSFCFFFIVELIIRLDTDITTLLYLDTIYKTIYLTTFNRELNYKRMNYRFEKTKLFHYMNFRLHPTYNWRGVWHTLYAMLLSNHVT